MSTAVSTLMDNLLKDGRTWPSWKELKIEAELALLDCVKDKENKDGLVKNSKRIWHLIQDSTLNCIIHSNCNSVPGASSLALARHAKIKSARDSSVGRKLPAKSVMCLMKSQMGHNVRNRMKAYRVLKNLEASDDAMVRSNTVNVTIRSSNPLLSVLGNEQVGFIGLDIMAKRMATRLVLSKADRKLQVWDFNGDNCEAFVKEHKGCSIAFTPKDIVESCNIIYVALTNVESSTSVYHGPCGIISLPNLMGKKFIECSSYTPEHMIQVEDVVISQGGIFLEAVAYDSNVVPIEMDNLVFLCGGSRLLYNEVTMDLNLMGKAKHFFGKTGEGSKARMIVNMAMGTMINALGEGLSLASKCRLALNEFLEVLNDKICVSNVLSSLKDSDSLVNGYDQHHLFTKGQLADMKHALNVGDSVGVALPVAESAYEQFKRSQKSADGYIIAA